MEKILEISLNITANTIKAELLNKNFPTVKRGALSQLYNTLDPLGI